MGRKPKLSTKEKVYICETIFKTERKSVSRALSNDFNIDKKTISTWNKDVSVIGT